MGTAGTVLGSALALAGAAYWTTLSPYSQALGEFPYRATARGSGGRTTVALTFDDGPNEPFTSQVAEVLQQHAIRATFFQVGRLVQRNAQVTRALAAAGHVIGNHSHTHTFGRCWSRTAVEEEMAQAQAVFATVLPGQPALYRPPWLARTPALFQAAAARSLHPVSGQFCHPLEAWQPAPERIARHALATVRHGGVLILHDGHNGGSGDRANTVAALKLIVTGLLARQVRFETLDRLLGLPAYR